MQPRNRASDPGFQSWVFKIYIANQNHNNIFQTAKIKLAFESRRHSSASSFVTQEIKELGVISKMFMWKYYTDMNDRKWRLFSMTFS